MTRAAAVAVIIGAAACGGPAAPSASPTPAPIGNVAPPPPAGVVDAEVRAPVAADLPRYADTIPGDGALAAVIDTSLGTIRCRLLGDAAPATVANFIGLATGKKAWQDPRTGEVRVGVPFYDGLTFHRVIPEFMIQGGDPLGTGMGGPGYEFGIEVDPQVRHVAGALAMANAGPDTNGSQFYVTEVPTEFLDGNYTVFGVCGELDVVAAIARVPTGAADRPVEPVVIRKVTITRE